MFILTIVLFSTFNHIYEVKSIQFPTYEKCLVFKESVNKEFQKSSSADQRLVTDCQSPTIEK